MLATRRALIANPDIVLMAPKVPTYTNMVTWLVGFLVILLVTHQFLLAFFGSIVGWASVHAMLVRYAQKEPNFGGQIYARLLRWLPPMVGRRRWSKLGTDPDWIELEPS